MNSEDISRFVHGCDIGSLYGNDLEGHVGIVMMYTYLTRPNFDMDRFSKENQMDIDMCMTVSNRLEDNGLYRKHNWAWRSRLSLLSTLKHKSRSAIKDWCHIAGIASGYIGK